MPPHLSSTVGRAGLVFVSGQLAFQGPTLLKGDVAAQTTQCLANLEAALHGQGLDRRHVMKTTAWLTDASDFVAFDAAYAAFFGDIRPARSTVVAKLVIPGARVEIEAVAADAPR